MLNRLQVCLLAALIAFAPLALAQSAKSSAKPAVEKKSYDFKDAGKQMEYALFVPGAYDKAKKSPLIVALHGLYSNPQQLMRYPGLTDLAQKHGYIVVAPMGYNSRGWYGARVMVGAQASDPANMSELSEKDVMNVLEIVRKDYTIDADRIYLVGHSMGGGGTWHLAMKYPDLFAALAPIAPAPTRLPADLEKIKHLPVMLVQGAKDAIVKPEWVRPYAQMMKKLEMVHEYIEDTDGDHLSVAFKHMPRIFEFFDKHARKDAAAK